MPNFALLNNVEHQDVKIITERSARYGDNLMHAPVFPFEFRRVQAFYPILLQQDSKGGFQPVALFGFEQGENLFLDSSLHARGSPSRSPAEGSLHARGSPSRSPAEGSGWQAAYIPAMLRREPFLIGFQKPQDPSEGDMMRVLSLDMDHPRVNTEVGEALFHPLGGRTDFLEDAANLLEAIYEGLEHGKAFVGALQEQDLIEAVTLEIPLRDGSRNQLLGFHCLAEEKVQALSGDVLGAFQEKGFLMPLFMILASMGNIQHLIEMKNRTLESGHALDV